MSTVKKTAAVTFLVGGALIGAFLMEAGLVTGTLSKSIPTASLALAASNPDPEDLYQEAYNKLNSNYLDRTFNSQDWSRWRHRYDGKLKTMEDSYKAIETMTASLGDPYTRYLKKEAMEDEIGQIKAQLFGVGMQLGMNQDHKVVVIAPLEDTPAYRAGVSSGDQLIEVDGKPTQGLSLEEVVKQIRGPIGTKVSIKVARGTEFLTFDLVRAEIHIKAVSKVTKLPGNIGYIRLDSFISKDSADEMKKALRELEGTSGIILDLRNNPGGLLSNAIEIASQFLPRGIIVSTLDAEGTKSSQQAFGRPICKTPLVLLVNHGSASASEILSGALHDNRRAKIVGENTFGKGLVQSINKMSNGSGMNITIAKYLTPADIDIHKTGIKPDYEVELSPEDFKSGKGPWWQDPTFSNFKMSPTDGKDIQLNKAIEILRGQAATTSAANEL